MSDYTDSTTSAYAESEPCFIQPSSISGTWRENGTNFIPLKDPVGNFVDWSGGTFTWVDVDLGFNSAVISDIWDGVNDAQDLSMCSESSFGAIEILNKAYSTYQIPNAQLLVNHIVSKYIEKVRVQPADIIE